MESAAADGVLGLLPKETERPGGAQRNL